MSHRTEELIELLRGEISTLERRLAEKPASMIRHAPVTDVTDAVNHAKGWARWIVARVQDARPDLVGKDGALDHQAAVAAGILDAHEARLYQRVRALRSR